MKLNDLEYAALTEMERYGLTDWVFQWGTTAKYQHCFGMASSDSRVISMSRVLVSSNNEERCIRTVRHEIAHAIVGSWHSHNGVWQKQMIKMGLEPKATWDCFDTVPIPPLYTANCVCGKGYSLNRLNSSAYRCSDSSCRSPLVFIKNTKRKAIAHCAKLGLDATLISNADWSDLL